MPSAEENLSFRTLPRSPLQVLEPGLPWIFLLFAAPLVVFLAIWTPAFQSPDETNHFYRASQIARGDFIGGTGEYADSAVQQLYAYVAPLPYHPEARMSAAGIAGERSVRWSGHLVFQTFPNTVTVSPAGYLPQALGILIGQKLGLGVLETLILVRLLNSLVAIAICVYALSICRRGRVLIFALLLLPMTLSLFASASQDATLIALACLAFSLVSRQLAAGNSMPRTSVFVLALSLLVLSVGRPPYATLLLVLFIPGLLPRWRKAPGQLAALALAALITVCTIAWWFGSYSVTREFAHPDSTYGNVNAKLQVIALLHHPAVAAELLGYIFRHTAEYIAGTIGILGWLDTPMPALYYLAMILVLAVAAIAETAAGLGPSSSFPSHCDPKPLHSSRRALQGTAILREGQNGHSNSGTAAKCATSFLLCAACAGVLGVFAVEYLIWTPVGVPGIYGVQGRYFIPLMIAAAVGLPQLGNSSKTYERATLIVVAAQLLTCFVLPHVILARYYAG